MSEDDDHQPPAEGRRRRTVAEAGDGSATPPAAPDAAMDPMEPMDDAAAAQPGMRSVLRFRGRDVAVGLTWHLANDVADARSEAVQVAGDEERDLWCLKTEGEPQIGVGDTSHGHKAGMPALAAEIASEIPAEWAGMFEIDGAFYVLSARSGAIDRDSDYAYSNFEDALELFRDLCGRSVNKYYTTHSLAGRDFGLANVEPIDLDEVVKKFSIRLQDLSASGAILRKARPYLMVAGAIAAFCVLFPAQLLQVRRLLHLAPNESRPKLVVAPMPWTGQPKAEATLARCLDAMERMPYAGGGWDGVDVRCDGRHVVLKLKRAGSVATTGAPIGWLIDWVKEQGPLVAEGKSKIGKPTLQKVNASGADVVWDLPFDKGVPRWKDADKPPKGPLAEQRTRIWSDIERHYESSAFGDGMKGPYAKVGKVRITTSMSGAHAYDGLMRTPTMTIPEVRLTLATMAVTLEARFHELVGIPTPTDKDLVRQPDPKAWEQNGAPKPET